jgi:glutaconyl-CoA/methylmalonyl-CoA decarboxylase subunit gamma
MDLGSGLYVTVVGMGLVFFSLAVLMLAMMLLDRVFPNRPAAVADESSPGARSPRPVAVAAASGASALPAARVADGPFDGPFDVVLGEKKHRVELRDLDSQPMIVVVDGEEHRVQRGGGDRSRLVIDGQTYAARVTESGAGYVSVRVGDDAFRVGLPAPALAAEKASAVAATEATPVAEGLPVPAPLPGRILKVSVEVGETVARGQELCVIEAMKMENSIRAPRDGTVREVRTQAGQNVTPGQVLVVL